jgi:hypothetical protein
MNPRWLVAMGGLAVIVGLLVSSKAKADRYGGNKPATPAPPDAYVGLPSWRRRMLACVLEHADNRTLYEWGGGHGHGNDYGLDCSGLVNVCAQSAGLSVAGNADRYYRDLPSVAAPTPGDLALYGTTERATHVRVVTAWDPDASIAECVGAEGGGPNVTTPAEALAQNAYVRRVADHTEFGAAFLGFRSLEPYAATARPQSAPMRPSPPG